MNHFRSIAVTLACAPLILASHAPETKVAFTVAEGTSLKKIFTSQLDLELDEMRILRDGQEPDGVPELEMKVTTDLEVVVRDEYLALREGSPRKLRRTFDSIDVGTMMSMEVNLQGQTHNQESPVQAGSELEGETIEFAWNDETKEYDVAFPEEEGDRELLVDLCEDMDLRAFLPDREVEIGDEWEIEPRDISTVMAPGGDLKLVPEELSYDMAGMSGQMGELSDWFDEHLEGKVVCRLTDVRAEGETRVAVIAIELTLSNDVDLTEMAQEELDRVEMPPGAGEIDVEHMRIDLHIEGEGVLLWDLKAGHFHALDVSTDLEMKMDIGVSLELPGFGDVMHQQEFDMSGSLTFGAEIQ
ncbi:MAG: hypothetical protein H6831_09280 [Planctomycetes bacterium]|nr:hypothetical protein [Planctomycetota bacterium]MCB9904585.1 hypothetical protein [Planctomycetota bacterium]